MVLVSEIVEILLQIIIIICDMYVGVYLSLKGVVYANNSMIRITEIGETNPDTDLNNGLQCITDRMPCCRNAFRAGEWYIYTGSDRTMVSGSFILLTDTNFVYRNRGYDDGTVNLNRPSGVIMPTGLFCCEVPDFAGDSRSLCAYIGILLFYCMYINVGSVFILTNGHDKNPIGTYQNRALVDGPGVA